MRRVAGLGCLLLLMASVVSADDVRPIQVQIKELSSGAFQVQWSVPKVIPAQAMPSPHLPATCRVDGARVLTDQPTAWLNRQVYRCPDGLAGQEIGIRFPGFNLGLSTLLKVELQSGDVYAHMLSPGEDSWRIPAASEGGLSELLKTARSATVDGLRHFAAGWAHWTFLVVLLVLGDLRTGVRLATWFMGGQLAAVVATAVMGLQIDPPLAEIGLAVATILLAREALRPPDERTQITALVVSSGVVHGLGVLGQVAAPGDPAGPALIESVLCVLGMDTALLVSLAVFSVVAKSMLDVPGEERYRRVGAYGAAAVAVAITIGTVVDGPTANAANTTPPVELPRILSPETRATLPTSGRLASQTPDATVQSFVSIEAFEVRHEVLVRLEGVAPRIGLRPAPVLAVEDQESVKKSLRDLVFAESSLEIDGERVTPTSERVDFLTVDDKGVLPRPAPVPEEVESAWVGVTAVYFTPATSRSLALSWDVDADSDEIPATVTDPEATRTVLLSPREPVLRWENELVEDPAPTVSTTAVEPTELVIPAWSLLPFAAAIALGVMALRGRYPTAASALSRVLLVIAVLLGPLGKLSVALPFSVGTAPGPGEAKRILTRVLPNIYRAFEFREEGAVFDRLASAVTGDVLTEIYLEHRKVLEMEERGGARARVEAVEVIDVESVEPADPSGFSARVVWTVGGTVTHFGHRHFRQNRYEARISLVPDNDVWKIDSIEVFDEQRLR